MQPASLRQLRATFLMADWKTMFDGFFKEKGLRRAAELSNLQVKTKHTIIEPWPYTVGLYTPREEFEVMRASQNTGKECYVEFERIE